MQEQNVKFALKRNEVKSSIDLQNEYINLQEILLFDRLFVNLAKARN